MECPFIVLLVGSTALSPERGSLGRRLARAGGSCLRPVPVLVGQGAVPDVSWAARGQRLPNPAPRPCTELRAAAGGLHAETLLDNAVRSKGRRTAKTSRRDAEAMRLRIGATVGVTVDRLRLDGCQPGITTIGDRGRAYEREGRPMREKPVLSRRRGVRWRT